MHEQSRQSPLGSKISKQDPFHINIDHENYNIRTPFCFNKSITI